MDKFIKMLKESSLSRIYNASKEHDCGTISAFRSSRDCNEGQPFSIKENRKRSAVLKAKLLQMGYGVTKISGTYVENYGKSNAVEVKEDSYFVVDLKDDKKLKKNLIKLGLQFEQDSITFQEKDGSYFLISSNKCPDGYPGNGSVGKEVKLGKPLFGKDGVFHSKINGRPFIFEGVIRHNEVLTDHTPTEIRSILKLTELIVK